MRSIVGVLIGFALMVTAAPAAAEFDVRKVDASVIRIQKVLSRGGRARYGGHGTGFVINSEGFVITNNHVIAVDRSKLPGDVQVRFVVPDGDWRKLRRVTIVAAYPKLDLAILRVEGLSRPAVTLSELGHSEMPAKGENVFAVGFPGAADASARSALRSTLTSGIVGKIFIGRGGKTQDNRPVIQHSAGISPGNSGGPLFNQCNEVIGVNTFVATSKFTVKREGGKIVARGAAVSGVYYSPHVASVLRILRARNVSFNGASGICRITKPGQDPMIFVYIGVAVLLAAASLLLALRRPRERVVKVVESYSQMLRRKGHAPTAGRTGPVGGEAATVPGGGAGPVKWTLSGTDGSGKVVRISLTEQQLGGAGNGLVIGRQHATSDVVLTDASVSRSHARLTESGDQLLVEDLGSANGTRVDGAELSEGTPVPVSQDASIEFGDVKVTLSRG